MKKKLLSALLCVAMVASLVVGCGAKEEAPAADAPAAAEAAAKAAAEQAAKDAEAARQAQEALAAQQNKKVQNIPGTKATEAVSEESEPVKGGKLVLATDAASVQEKGGAAKLKVEYGLGEGSEGKGISEKVKKNCDFNVKIPMKGKVTSLNAAVSTGIIVYEAVKQRIVK